MGFKRNIERLFRFKKVSCKKLTHGIIQVLKTNINNVLNLERYSHFFVESDVENINTIVADEDFLKSIEELNINNEIIQHYLNESNFEILEIGEIIKKYPNLKILNFNLLKRSDLRIKISNVDYPKLVINIKESELFSLEVNKSFLQEIEIWYCNFKHDSLLGGIQIIGSEVDEIIISPKYVSSIWVNENSKIGTFHLFNPDKKIESFRFNSSSADLIQLGNTEFGRLDFNKSTINSLKFYSIKFSKPYFWSIGLDNASFQNIVVSDSIFSFDLNFSSDNLQKIELKERCTFKSLTINHKNANIKINDCTIEEKLTIGSKSTEANSSNFEIINNTFVKGVFFGKHHIKDEFKIEGNRLQNGTWKFYGFSLGGDCNSEITDQFFDDVTFQNCDFSNFDFKDTSIHLAEIIESTWKEVDIAGQKRILFKGDDEELNEKDIDKLKKQYSYFRKKFENENSYEVSSKFKISEALTRIKLLKAEKSSRQYLLKISKWLNLFGESIAKPIYWYLIFLFIFCFIYTFTGFHIDGEAMRYEMQYPDIQKGLNLNCSDLENLFHALVFSFKNIVPIKLDSDFYLSTGKEFKSTQLLSMFQKLLNIIIIGALFTSMRNFFRK